MAGCRKLDYDEFYIHVPNHVPEYRSKPLCNNDYQPCYDEGLSARLGGRRIPLILKPQAPKYDTSSAQSAGGTRTYEPDFIFKHTMSESQRGGPSRILPDPPQSWWPPTCTRMSYREKPPSRPRYRNFYSDLGCCPPNETVIRQF